MTVEQTEVTEEVPTETSETPTEQTPVVEEETSSEEVTTEFVPLTSEDLSFPEGVEVKEEVRGEFLDILNNREITPAEQAQKLVDLQMRLSQEASEAGSTAWTEMQTQWQDEVRNDPEVGGAQLDGVLLNVGKVVEQYGTPELREVFDLTGAGNNIHVVKFLNAIAKDMTEGGHVSGTVAPKPTDPAASLYPSMANK